MRGLRDALEHFDERLDEFLLKDLVGQFISGPVVGSLPLLKDAVTSMFRLVDPAQDTFVLLGESYTFGPLREAVDEILRKAEKMNDEGGRLI